MMTSYFKLISKSFQFFISVQRDQGRDSRAGSWEGMSCLGQEVQDCCWQQLSVFAKVQLVVDSETPEEMEGPARVKRGNPSAPRFSCTGHTLPWPLKKAVQLFAGKITIQKGKEVTSIGVDTGEAGGVPGLRGEGEEAQQEAASC